MKCFEYIYIYLHTYILCVFAESGAQILQSFIGSSTSVSKTLDFKVLWTGTKVIAGDRGLA